MRTYKFPFRSGANPSVGHVYSRPEELMENSNRSPQRW